MDGAPSSKRVRFKPSVGVSSARARGASLALPATTASCSRGASPARGGEEEEEALLEGEEVKSELTEADIEHTCW